MLLTQCKRERIAKIKGQVAMTAEQRQLLDELDGIHKSGQGEMSIVAWRAAEEIRWLIAENEQLSSGRKSN